MSFKDHDKKTYIVDLAKDFGARRISKRDFLRKAGMAGIGFSAFNTALLGNTRPFRGTSLVGDAAYAQDVEMNKWLKDAAKPVSYTHLTLPTNREV